MENSWIKRCRILSGEVWKDIGIIAHSRQILGLRMRSYFLLKKSRKLTEITVQGNRYGRHNTCLYCEMVKLLFWGVIEFPKWTLNEIQKLRGLICQN